MVATDRSGAQGRAKLPGFIAPPTFAAEAPVADSVTEYDAEHFIDYARMLDAERAGEDWRAAATAILRMDPADQEAQVRSCWDSHLTRAHWIVTSGYRQLLDQAGLAPSAIDTPPVPVID